MDKFLIDPPENITTETINVPYEEVENLETGPPPPTEVIKNDSIIPSFEIPSFKLPEEPVEQPVEQPIVEPAAEPFIESISEPSTTLLKEQTDDSLFKFTENPTPLPPEQPRSWFSFFFWTFILLAFIVISLYYATKYFMNESNYIIKINANKFQVSLDEMKEDLKDWLLSWRDWNEDMYDKMNQFFFRQHIKNKTFKVKKYKIPKYLITSNDKSKKAE